MTELLYLEDHYLKEFDSKISEVPDPKSLILEKTAFYPRGGGQPSDLGSIVFADGSSHNVVESSKTERVVVHTLESPISTPDIASLMGSNIHGSIDWPLRYAHMRYHTALHVLSGVVFQKFASKITGGQIYPDRARLDFSLDDLSKDRLATIESEVNRIVNDNHEVRTYWLTTEEALQKKEMYKLSADLLPKGLQKLRIVEIVGFDAQLDGGTHVAKTSEIGEIRISKTQNKGKDNKRIEIVLP
ncbi:MAG: alanyl-tRNA editing protein [Nitrososphaerota archaeon]|nr:alanyl-tRNA editing protein [Nitrososphaerota archaeon]